MSDCFQPKEYFRQHKYFFSLMAVLYTNFDILGPSEEIAIINKEIKIKLVRANIIFITYNT